MWYLPGRVSTTKVGSALALVDLPQVGVRRQPLGFGPVEVQRDHVDGQGDCPPAPRREDPTRSGGRSHRRCWTGGSRPWSGPARGSRRAASGHRSRASSGPGLWPTCRRRRWRSKPEKRENRAAPMRGQTRCRRADHDSVSPCRNPPPACRHAIAPASFVRSQMVARSRTRG